MLFKIAQFQHLVLLSSNLNFKIEFFPFLSSFFLNRKNQIMLREFKHPYVLTINLNNL